MLSRLSRYRYRLADRRSSLGGSMGWLVYAAMAAGLLPLVAMAIGYLYVSFKKRDET
jgi:hypothetical protein